MKRVGIIFLDGAEVIIRIYEAEASRSYKLLHTQNRDLTSFKHDEMLKTVDAIEVIAEVYFTGHGMNVTDWKICARNVPEATINHIASVTGFTVETLLLNREQDLLCKALFEEV
jgi:hypothetical protein